MAGILSLTLTPMHLILWLKLKKKMTVQRKYGVKTATILDLNLKSSRYNNDN